MTTGSGVASFAEAWIEILHYLLISFRFYVASFAEAWIEIVDGETEMDGITVASFAEAWIEITLAGIKRLWKAHVASFAEAWIEMSFTIFFPSTR